MMPQPTSDFRSFFRGRTVTLMGLGRLGRGVGDAEFLAETCAWVRVTDLKPATELADSVERLRRYPNVELHLGGHPVAIFEDADFVVKGAGVPLDSPHITAAEARGVPVYMSTALFAKLSQAHVVGVTGTRGKSTTTQLIYETLRAAGLRTMLGGNVRGMSTLAQLPQVTSDTYAVLELDSWQLQGFDGLAISPHLAVFTSFFPDHMNYYRGDMARYLHDKSAIYRHQRPGDVLVATSEVLGQLTAPPPAGCVTPQSFPPKAPLALIGAHNRINAALALSATQALGVDPDAARAAISACKPLEGRLQFVRTWRGVDFFNDSNATTQEATLAALSSFQGRDVVLLFGGADKALPIDALVEAIKRRGVRGVAFAGSGTERLKSLLPGLVECASMHCAVETATRMAKPGDVVLLSPAFASFGVFGDEYDRSDQFLRAVRSLPARP